MTRRGFVWFIGCTAIMLSLPLFAVLGSAVAWVLLCFFLLAIAGIWHALQTNQRARSTEEELVLTGTRLDLRHTPPQGAPLIWGANRYWVTVNLRNDGPVEKYLTLRGGGREVELGAFLTSDERETLYRDLTARIRTG